MGNKVIAVVVVYSICTSLLSIESRMRTFNTIHLLITRNSSAIQKMTDMHR